MRDGRPSQDLPLGSPLLSTFINFRPWRQLPRNVELTLAEVRCALQNLEPNKGSGPDHIPNRLLKARPSAIAQLLLILFNHSLRTGKFPSCWKDGLLTPLFKSGDLSEATNYRGIVILSVILKLFKKLVTHLLESMFSDLIQISTVSVKAALQSPILWPTLISSSRIWHVYVKSTA